MLNKPAIPLALRNSDKMCDSDRILYMKKMFVFANPMRIFTH